MGAGASGALASTEAGRPGDAAHLLGLGLLQKGRARAAAQLAAGAARHRHEVVVRDVRPAGAERAARRLQRVHLDGQIRAARRRHGDGAGEARALRSKHRLRS